MNIKDFLKENRGYLIAIWYTVVLIVAYEAGRKHEHLKIVHRLEERTQIHPPIPMELAHNFKYEGQKPGGNKEYVFKCSGCGDSVYVDLEAHTIFNMVPTERFWLYRHPSHLAKNLTED